MYFYTAHLHIQELLLYSGAMISADTDNTTSDKDQNEIFLQLHNLRAALMSWFDNWLEIQPSAYRYQCTNLYFQLSKALATLGKWSQLYELDIPMQNMPIQALLLSSPLLTIDIPMILTQLCCRFHEANSMKNQMPANTLWCLKSLMVAIKNAKLEHFINVALDQSKRRSTLQQQMASTSGTPDFESPYSDLSNDATAFAASDMFPLHD